MTLSKSSTTAAKSSPRRAAHPADGTDAIALLTQDHREVKKLFTAYQKLADATAPGDDRQEIAEQICAALSTHATMEEEIFYPALREAEADAADDLDEAEVEHASVKNLIAQIRAMDPEDDLYNAKLKVLGEYVAHHVQEEENEMFPQAKKAGLDLDDLGAQLQSRKDELLATLL